MSWKKKILTPERFGEKFFQDKNHSYPTPSQTSSGHVSHLGGEGRNGFDTFVNVIHQQNGWRVHDVVVFKTKVLHFKIESTPIKRNKLKEKVQKNPQFPCRGRTKAFRYEIVFRGIQPCFLGIGALGLFWTNQGSEVSEDTWGTFRTLWSKKSSFLKEMNFCIYKGFMDVFYILTSEWKKKHKMCIWDCFFTMCSTDLTCLNATI